MTTKQKKKIATWIIVPLMLLIFILDIVTVVLCNKYAAHYTITEERFDGSYSDRIHFLNTENSDAILLESDGHFAMIDAGEGSYNPRRSNEHKGFEEVVISYIKKVATKSDGKAHLDFILGTHFHYDHIGCFHAIITDPDIMIDKAYFKEYDPNIGKGYEGGSWGLRDVYEQIITDLQEKNIERVSDLPKESFAFGNFTLKFFNTENSEELFGKGENAASVGVKVTKGMQSAFLAADITKSSGLLELIEDEVGNADILKIGHHGYYGSGSKSFMKKISPKIAVVTNKLGKIYPNEKWILTMNAKVPIYATYENDGLIISFAENGEYILTNRIH